MFLPDGLNPIIKEIMARFSHSNSDCSNGNGNGSKMGNQKDSNSVSIAPSQALVIAGLIGGALEVTSVLVDKNQAVEIVLTGSLKEKTKLEKMLDQIGSMPFDDVMKVLFQKFS